MDQRPLGTDPLRFYGEVIETTLLIADIVAVSLLVAAVLANTPIGQFWLGAVGHVLAQPAGRGLRPLPPTLRGWLQAMAYGMGSCC